MESPRGSGRGGGAPPSAAQLPSSPDVGAAGADRRGRLPLLVLAAAARRGFDGSALSRGGGPGLRRLPPPVADLARPATRRGGLLRTGPGGGRRRRSRPGRRPVPRPRVRGGGGGVRRWPPLRSRG